MAIPPEGSRSVIKVDGKEYHLTKFLVHSKHPDECPRLVSLIKDFQPLELGGGEEFVFLYVPAKVLEGKR